MNDNLVVRQTYIMLAVKDNIKYIFNRSVRWDSIINCKNIQPLIDVLGKEAIRHFSETLVNDSTELIDKSISRFTSDFISGYNKGYLGNYDGVDLYVVKILPLANINLSDQQIINQYKEELCKQYDAKMRKDEIIGYEIIDKLIGDKIKKRFKEWICEIYNAITKYAKLIYDSDVYKAFLLNKDTLNSEIRVLNSEICENKKILSRQNYMINKLNEEISAKQKEIDSYITYC